MPPVPSQPTLTDGVVVLRPWRDDDAEAAAAGHDDLIAHWYGAGGARPTVEQFRQTIERWRRGYADDRGLVNFAVEHDGLLVGSVEIQPRDGAGSLSWTLYAGHRGRGHATRAVRVLVDYALTGADDGGLGLGRVECHVEPENLPSLRVASRAGLRREGIRRIPAGTGDRPETTEYVILARLASDPPMTDPEGFRALLNSILPRKRGISQLLVCDPDDRVLLCQLTYKRDWDLPGGVIEVGESPRLGLAREVDEELSLTLEPGELLLTDWLPPWGGWDDAICLVFDGGTHGSGLLEEATLDPREIKGIAFCTPAEVAERAADFTARRISAALEARRSRSTGRLGGDYTESGRR